MNEVKISITDTDYDTYTDEVASLSGGIRRAIEETRWESCCTVALTATSDTESEANTTEDNLKRIAHRHGGEVTASLDPKTRRYTVTLELVGDFSDFTS
jgi:hypothetical protein